MRAIVLFIAGLVIIVFGNYWLNPYLPACRPPVSYAIGQFDERFGLSREEALASLKAAEAVWEEGLGRDDIFAYDEDGPFKINFIYDERQRQAEAALSALSDLETRGDANEVLTRLHEQLVEEYEAREREHAGKLAAYETRLAAFNAEVQKHNAEGGATPEEYAELESRRQALEREREVLEAEVGQLAELAGRINSVGEKGNQLIGEYNDRVADFNNTFAHGHEYTQGDYQARQISVYSFTDKDELAMVLAHELGHALSIGHVENPESLMYYLMNEQPKPPRLSAEDIAAFRAVCEASFPRRLLASWQALYNGSVNH